MGRGLTGMPPHSVRVASASRVATTLFSTACVSRAATVSANMLPTRRCRQPWFVSEDLRTQEHPRKVSARFRERTEGGAGGGGAVRGASCLEVVCPSDKLLSVRYEQLPQACFLQSDRACGTRAVSQKASLCYKAVDCMSR